jgi:predicted  nucleic acid-binding Zn-ribbon protein
MNPDIQAAHAALNQLDVIDRELDALKAEAKRTPGELKEEHAAVSALDELRVAAAAALVLTEGKQRDAERSLEKLEKRIKKAQDRLPSLGTMGQIEATQREIAAVGAEAGEVETRILELMEQAEDQETDLAAQVERLANARALVAGHEASWLERKPVLAARVGVLDADRVAPAAVLRPDVTRRYQLGRNQSQWKVRTGLTWVQADRVCRTCRTQVSARWLQECAAHTAYHACDSCKRMLVPPPPEEDVEEDE